MIAFVILLSSPHHHHHRPPHHHHRPPQSPIGITRQVFGGRWKSAWCISYYESHHQLHAVNGQNLGPWQISVSAHPWVNPRLLTSSWRYSAQVAYRISSGGRDWAPWTTHYLCGV